MDERQKQLYDEWVDYLNFETMGEKTTIAFCKLKNGFEIVGTSACVNPKDFNLQVGRYYAKEDIMNQLGSYVGFYRQNCDSVKN